VVDTFSSMSIAWHAWTARPVAGPLTVGDAVNTAAYLVAASVVHSAAAYLIRRRLPHSPTTASMGGAQPHVIHAVGKPVYLMIWLYAVHLASDPILAKLPLGTELLALRRAADVLFKFGALIAIFWLLIRGTRVLEHRLKLWVASTQSRMAAALVPLAGSALRTGVIVMGIILELPALGLPPEYARIASRLTSIALVLAVAGLLSRSVTVLVDTSLLRFDLTAENNLEARKASTRFHLIARVLYVVISIVAIGAILMMFDEVRHLGASLLASAGIAGIVVGVAAQKTLANLFAGFQLAFSQPVRQDDVVVVEGEWGRVEEITLTFVTVRIWDDRRLVLPLSYFIEKPFQNWTRSSSEITGSVLFWVDYSFPVTEGRSALKEMIESNPHWDKRFWNLQVSDTSERSLQLRVLATSANSSSNWDLRCEIREKFTAFIQQHYPQCLPTIRASVAEPRTPRAAIAGPQPEPASGRP
jgi:small-conductance mechanosensitive channel